MPMHTVAQGECISSIAYDAGLFWETIWNDGRNQGIRDKRQNPNALQPGDNIFVPDKRMKDESCPTTQRSIFRLKGVPVKFVLRVLDKDGQPRVGVPYALSVDGKKKSGEIPDDGKISETIPPHAKKAKLTLTPADSPKEDYEWDLGFMTPFEDPGGVQGRLKNLGYYIGAITGSIDDATAEAIRKFQLAEGLPVTGQADSDTTAALAQRHGG